MRSQGAPAARWLTPLSASEKTVTTRLGGLRVVRDLEGGFGRRDDEGVAAGEALEAGRVVAEGVFHDDGHADADEEGGADARFAFDPDGAAHEGGEAAADGEAEAGAAVGAGDGGVDLEEVFEETRLFVRGDADAGVGDAEGERDLVGGGGVHADIEADAAAVSEFDGVAEEVDEDLAKAGGVALDGAGNVGAEEVGEREVFLAGVGFDEIESFAHARDEVEGLAFQFDAAGLDFGVVERVVDEREEGFAGELDGLEVVALLGIEGSVGEDVGHADDAVEGGADLVADGGEERALGLVGVLGGAGEAPGFLDGGLEGGVGGAEALVGFEEGDHVHAFAGDVVVDTLGAEDAAGGVADDAAAVADVADLVGGREDAVFDVEVGVALGEGEAHVFFRGAVGGQHDEAPDGKIAGEGVAMKAVKGEHGVVPDEFTGVVVVFPDADAGEFGGEGHAFGEAGDFEFGVFAIVDILHGAGDAHDAALLGVGAADAAHPAGAAGAGAQLKLDVVGHAHEAALVEGGFNEGLVFLDKGGNADLGGAGRRRGGGRG